jgi:hypothetical protein
LEGGNMWKCQSFLHVFPWNPSNVWSSTLGCCIGGTELVRFWQHWYAWTWLNKYFRGVDTLGLNELPQEYGLAIILKMVLGSQPFTVLMGLD